jgi:hypothetical protein
MNTSKFSALALPTSPAPGPIGRGTGAIPQLPQAADARPNLPQRRERAHVPCGLSRLPRLRSHLRLSHSR